jgi:hypothetical protein
MDGKDLDGGKSTLTVSPYSMTEKKEISNIRSFTNIYVKNFPTPKFSEDDLKVILMSV